LKRNLDGYANGVQFFSRVIVIKERIKMKDKIKCKICQKEFKAITNTHLSKWHNMTLKEYQEKYAKIILSEKTAKHRSESLEIISRTPEWNKKNSKAKKQYYSIEENRFKYAKRGKDNSLYQIPLSEKHKENIKKGVNNHFKKNWIYKKTDTYYRNVALKLYGRKCELCNNLFFIKKLHIHHLDGNRQNNNIDNFSILCHRCHTLLHCRWAKNKRSQKILKALLENL